MAARSLLASKSYRNEVAYGLLRQIDSKPAAKGRHLLGEGMGKAGIAATLSTAGRRSGVNLLVIRCC